MKIMIVTDAWMPQVNGVVRSLQAIQAELEKLGHQVRVVGPDIKRWCALSVPTYTEIVLELFPAGRLSKIIEEFQPDTLHIATEGPLGISARCLCLKRGWRFTSAYHTRFPQFASARFPAFLKPVVEAVVYRLLHWFHDAADAVLVTTPSTMRELQEHRFQKTVLWPLGVDTTIFAPRGKYFAPYARLRRPILLYVGRVSVEKNLEAFLKLQTDGSKVVAGSGPDLDRLRGDYPEACFLGRLDHEELAHAYSAADLFVFPSKADTFGLVLLEACASGLRIAAYPVTGPKDVFEAPQTAEFVALNADLQLAVEQALALPESPDAPREFAEKHSWAASAAQFLAHLCPLTPFPQQK